MTNPLNEAWFQRLRQNTDEVLRARLRARALLEQRPADRFDGIGHLLGKVLPSESDIVSRFAEALGVGSLLVAQLRASELDPVHLPVPVLVIIGQVLELSEETFLELVWRDHERFLELERGAMSRGSPNVEVADVKRQLREAWSRASLDDPSNA